jgi:dTDP-4-dehydrorhamnose reductase
VKILVAGRSGQLARELVSRRWPHAMQCVALGRPDLDIRDEASVEAALGAQAPDLLVNAAAYTAVDRAESEADAAFALNASGARNLARAASRHGIPLIHVSTDYVFGGEGRRPWREDDGTAPQGVYARSKLAGEDAVREATARHVILRTSWLFAAHGHNFVHTMLRLAKSQAEVSVVGDQWGCPTPAGDLARVVEAIASRPGPFGTYHYCGRGAVTWHGFAAEIFARAAPMLANVPKLRKISTAEFAAPAPRPAYSVLDTDKIRRDYGIAQRSWGEGLDGVLHQLAAGA